MEQKLRTRILHRKHRVESTIFKVGKSLSFRSEHKVNGTEKSVCVCQKEWKKGKYSHLIVGSVGIRVCLGSQSLHKTYIFSKTIVDILHIQCIIFHSDSLPPPLPSPSSPECSTILLMHFILYSFIRLYSNIYRFLIKWHIDFPSVRSS